MQKLPKKFFEHYLRYDGTSLYWKNKISPMSRYTIGAKAARLHRDRPFVSFRYDGILYSYAESVIVWVMHNDWPSENLVVDHIDCNPRNNKLNNLRAISRSANGLNKPKIVGIDRSKNKRFRVHVCGNYIGTYDTYDQAVLIRRKYVK